MLTELKEAVCNAFHSYDDADITKLSGQSVQSNFFFNWDSLHARLNCHYKAWSYQKEKHKKIKGNSKSLYKKPRVNRCLLILDLKPFRL